MPGIQEDDQFLELCSTWTAMSDGVGDNYTDTPESPKCQRCHMEPLETVTLKDADGDKYGKDALYCISGTSRISCSHWQIILN